MKLPIYAGIQIKDVGKKGGCSREWNFKTGHADLGYKRKIRIDLGSTYWVMTILQPTSSIITDGKSTDSNLVDFDRKHAWISRELCIIIALK